MDKRNHRTRRTTNATRGDQKPTRRENETAANAEQPKPQVARNTKSKLTPIARPPDGRTRRYGMGRLSSPAGTGAGFYLPSLIFLSGFGLFLRDREDARSWFFIARFSYFSFRRPSFVFLRHSSSVFPVSCWSLLIPAFLSLLSP